jgi:iron complex transport system ATP-binding protein
MDRINCVFCFCPLYEWPECGGNFKMLKNGIKDCSKCTLPHERGDYVIKKLKEKYPK